MQESIALAYVHPGWVYEKFSGAMHRFTAKWPHTPIIRARSGSLITQARNDVARAVTHMDVSTLVFIDTDIVWEPEQVWEIVGRSPIRAGLYSAMDFATGETFPSYVPHDAVSEAPFVVDGAGMGFTAIKVDVIEHVIERFGDPFGDLETTEYGRVGEDVGFCLRAADCGYATTVDPQVVVGHIKDVVI